MADHYKFLKVAPTASTEEIQTAIDVQYNYWRQLVTHHDPKRAHEANYHLQEIEEIRQTLLDPAKRVVYDQSLGAGGLADPEARLPAAIAPPQTPPGSSSIPAGSGKRTDAWLCLKCQTANTIGLQYCSECGAMIGRNCPSCRKMIANTATFCTYCGVDIETVLHQQAEARLRTAQAEARNRLEQLQNQIQVEREALDGLIPLRAKRFIFGGEGAKIYRETRMSGCRLMALIWFSLSLISAFGMQFILFLLLSNYDMTDDSAVMEMGVVLVMVITFWLVGIFAAIIPVILLGGWLQASGIRTEVNQRIQTKVARIAGLEQEIRELQITGR